MPGVGAGEQDAPVGGHRPAGPHLLAGDHPPVAVAHGPGAQAGEVGAGVGLGEELAPDVVAPAHGGQEPLLLGGRAVGHQRGADHEDGHVEEAGGDGVARLLLADDAGLVGREPAAAELVGPGGDAPAAVVERALPGAGRGRHARRCRPCGCGGRRARRGRRAPPSRRGPRRAGRPRPGVVVASSSFTVVLARSAVTVRRGRPARPGRAGRPAAGARCRASDTTAGSSAWYDEMSPVNSRASTSGSPGRNSPAAWPRSNSVGLQPHRLVVVGGDGGVDLAVGRHHRGAGVAQVQAPEAGVARKNPTSKSTRRAAGRWAGRRRRARRPAGRA